jgi:Na+/H+ antiporter NhaD/arsenite permease-like protein
MDALIAGGIFLVAYALIATEKFDRTLVALLGGLLVIALGVIDQETAFEAIDFNVIFLLAGMMIIAAGLAQTGFFEYIAGQAIHLSRGEPFRLLVILALLTAVLAAVLDNVTTVVLLTPVTLSIARTLGVSPLPYLLSQVFASNIGGTATLIGDPPNILIGSAAGLDFADFLVHLAPVVVLIMLGFLVILRFAFGRASAMEDDADRLDRLASIDPKSAIRDRGRMLRGLLVLGLTILGFLFHTSLGLEAATIALLGATVFMIVGPIDPHEALREIEWNTLFFFVGLFMLIEAVVHVGILGTVAESLAEATGGRLVLGPCVGDRRQHPVHRDRNPDRGAIDRQRDRRGCALVGARARRVPGREPDHRRGIGQHRRGQPRRAGRSPDHVLAVLPLWLGGRPHVTRGLDRVPVDPLPAVGEAPFIAVSAGPHRTQPARSLLRTTAASRRVLPPTGPKYGLAFQWPFPMVRPTTSAGAAFVAGLPGCADRRCPLFERATTGWARWH